MDADHDPIRDLREALRGRPATWELEQATRPRRVLSRRPDHGRAHRADLQGQFTRVWQRRGPALRRALRFAWSFAVALAIALRASARLTARATIVALVMSARAIGIVGRHLRSVVGSWAAARVRRSARRKIAHRKPADLTRPATPAVGPHSIPATANDAEHQLEEADRRRLEQRALAVGPDHPDVAVLLQLVAERCAARGASDEAMSLYARALRIQQTAFGADSPALRPLLADLAELERELGRDEDANRHDSQRRMLERPSIPTYPTDHAEAKGVKGAA